MTLDIQICDRAGMLDAPWSETGRVAFELDHDRFEEEVRATVGYEAEFPVFVFGTLETDADDERSNHQIGWFSPDENMIYSSIGNVAAMGTHRFGRVTPEIRLARTIRHELRHWEQTVESFENGEIFKFMDQHYAKIAHLVATGLLTREILRAIRNPSHDSVRHAFYPVFKDRLVRATLKTIGSDELGFRYWLRSNEIDARRAERQDSARFEDCFTFTPV